MLQMKKRTNRLTGPALLLAALGCLLGLPMALASGVAGNLDAGFGVGGVAYLASSGASALPIGIQSNGQVVLAGNDGGQWRILRVNADGSTDASFGSGGERMLFGDHGQDSLRDMAVDANDRIVLTGQVRIEVVTPGRGKKTTTSHPGRLTVVRLTADGDLDASFGTGGIVHTEIPGAASGVAQGDAIAIQADGSIVVAGKAFGVAGASSSGGGKGKKKKGGGDSTTVSSAICVLRYDTWGDLDGGFGTDGITVDDATAGDDGPFLGAIGIQASGDIVVGGNTIFLTSPPTLDLWVLTRYTSSGSVDAGFGRVSVSGQHLRGLAIDTSNRIVATGNHTGSGGAPGLIVSRHLSSGGVDASFGTLGVSAVDLGSESVGSAITVLQTGEIVVAADLFSSDFDLRPLRFDANGTLDLSFGAGGEGETLGATGTDHSSLHGMAIESNGDVLLSGMAADSVATDWLIARWCGG